MKNSTPKVWFITGASRGFGLLVARNALARGDQVVATARHPRQVIDALGQHDNLLAVQLDVSDEASAMDAARLAVERFGRIDVLLNNAGFGLLGAVEESSAAEVKAIFETNVFGLLHVTRAVTPYMRTRKSGHIINISSIGGYASYAGWGVYGASKFAVEGLTEALAIELAPLGIRATVVEPGFFRTDFLAANSLLETRARIDDYAATVGAMRDFAAGYSHKQLGDPAKLASAMLVLADSEQPPVRLPLGTDTVAKIHEKNRFVEAELKQWLELANSTDHDDSIVA
ncbi:oxidoreductase [Janthinobacterium agaricidamnosum]|uniref:Short chain dehydrogenase family protein n=1 Tax=Janthinobacterium agaricidamnosum NBRC 102515 = DSM 9628 TaxID=1349767 RepID=W0V8S0_9BURK|nr:oxidoreductase [Janthinobacterium agaricidamnosum]CDG83672.1 short chain dehydrogenase family protein [Janthinobacterium agaricidamnosum NBRC 102515 = DSM 9628]